jgi:5-methylcytosine-specific restriction endonuclease McrA
MPMDRSKYPPDWDRLANRIIVERAGLRCEWPGCAAVNGQPHPVTGSLVVLACIQLDHDPANNDEANLRASCQRCHTRHDVAQHRNSAGETRRAKQLDAGQQWLFDAGGADLSALRSRLSVQHSDPSPNP